MADLSNVALIVKCTDLVSRIEHNLPDTVPSLIEGVLTPRSDVNFLIEQLRRVALVRQQIGENSMLFNPKEGLRLLDWVEKALDAGPKERKKPRRA